MPVLGQRHRGQLGVGRQEGTQGRGWCQQQHSGRVSRPARASPRSAASLDQAGRRPCRPLRRPRPCADEPFALQPATALPPAGNPPELPPIAQLSEGSSRKSGLACPACPAVVPPGPRSPFSVSNFHFTDQSVPGLEPHAGAHRGTPSAARPSPFRATAPAEAQDAPWRVDQANGQLRKTREAPAWTGH